MSEVPELSRTVVGPPLDGQGRQVLKELLGASEIVGVIIVQLGVMTVTYKDVFGRDCSADICVTSWRQP